MSDRLSDDAKQQIFDRIFDVAVSAIKTSISEGQASELAPASASTEKVFTWASNVASGLVLDRLSSKLEVVEFAEAQARLVLVSFAIGTRDPSTIESVDKQWGAYIRKRKAQGLLPATVINDIILRVFEREKAVGTKKIGYQVADEVNDYLAAEAVRLGVKYDPIKPEPMEKRYRRLTASTRR